MDKINKLKQIEFLQFLNSSIPQFGVNLLKYCLKNWLIFRVNV
ncbi:hypothetical protein D1BOALGB6SA_3313 [Olavius sp. associated proteobacterium Delta 1]|nr:hypothetical protein D1BOALGB6SA_3313 [Olavius sp. associated proteobacterium Delta 1]